MIAAVADTHTVVWYLYRDPRLSRGAHQTIESAASAGAQLGVSAITVVELVYLVEKRRIDSASVQKLAVALANSANVFHEISLTSAISQQVATITREQIPDMPDRIIAATATYLGVPLISRDARIRTSAVSTIW